MDRTVPPGAALLLDFIGQTEAPKGYDTVFGNNQRKLAKPLTSMTIDEVIATGPTWTKHFGSSAAGRYQFMRDTLKGLKSELGLTGSEKLSADMQDRLGYHLLKRRGYEAFMAGQMGVIAFGLRLAQEWASFPVLRACKGQKRQVSRGQSYYAGDGLNKALVPAEMIEAKLAEALRVAGHPADQGPVATHEAPRVQTVIPPGGKPGFFDVLKGFFGHKPTTPKVPVYADTCGDPVVFHVQKMLRERMYYTKGMVDGLDGGFTQSAVAQARKDNGLADGGIDDAFLRALPSMPQRPVSEARSRLSLPAAIKHAPEPASGGLTKIGAGILATFLGAGTSDTVTAALTKATQAADGANDIIAQVQGVFATLSSVFVFLATHKTLILIALGILGVLWGIKQLADFWAKVRAAWF